MNLTQIFSVALILFAVIDIFGSIPIILELKKKTGTLNSLGATLGAGIIMFLFLFGGVGILNFFAVDLGSFAVAGAVVLFILGLEMILGREFFKHDDNAGTRASSIVPLAFPLIAGAGTMTTLISLRSQFELINITIGIFINLLIVYLVLSGLDRIEKVLSPIIIIVFKKFFGIILLAMGVKLFTSHFSLV